MTGEQLVNNLFGAIFTAFCGGAENGETIVKDTRIPLVSFTGSTKVGLNKQLRFFFVRFVKEDEKEIVKMVENTKSIKEEVVTREYTVNLHKRLHGVLTGVDMFRGFNCFLMNMVICQIIIFAMDGRVNAFYSTPSIYIDAKFASNESWALKTDDYFPYADYANGYWAGYFTSRPALKRYVRVMSDYYLATRQLEVFKGRSESGPGRTVWLMLWQSLNIMMQLLEQNNNMWQMITLNDCHWVMSRLSLSITRLGGRGRTLFGFQSSAIQLLYKIQMEKKLSRSFYL